MRDYSCSASGLSDNVEENQGVSETGHRVGTDLGKGASHVEQKGCWVKAWVLLVLGWGGGIDAGYWRTAQPYRAGTARHGHYDVTCLSTVAPKRHFHNALISDRYAGENARLANSMVQEHRLGMRRFAPEMRWAFVPAFEGKFLPTTAFEWS